MFNARIKKKTLSVLASVAVAASLVVAPVVTAGAAAAELIGEVGQRVTSTSDMNHVEYWENLYKDRQADCYSHDPKDGDNAHGSVTDQGKTVTLNAFQDSWPGDQWVLLVVKGGSVESNVIVNPQAGVPYASLENKSGNQADVSHWIVCKGTTPTTEPRVVTPALSFSLPSCEAAGAVLSRSSDADVTWTRTENADGSVTWTAAPAPGTTFPDGVKTSWTVPAKLAADSEQCRGEQPKDEVTTKETFTYDCTTYEVTVTTVTTTVKYSWSGSEWVAGTPQDVSETTTRPMTVAEKLECPVPETTVEYRTWVDGEWDCGDTEVTQTREVVETTYDRDANGNIVVASSLRTEQQTRPLTAAEIGEECPLVPGDIVATCLGDVPYLGYAVTLPAGYTTDDPTPLTVTFVNPEGEDVVIANQPLAGSLLWPGAQATEPKMWPGWELVAGTYVQTGGNFGWSREGITVHFEVNPAFETVVEYPAATALCANPPKQAISPEGPSDEEPGEEPAEEPAGSESSDPEGALAATGGGVSPIVPIAGGAALLLGLGALLTVAYQRRRATS